MDESKLRAALASEEPDYRELAQLGQDAVVPLRDIVKNEGPELASKATYVLSLVGTDDAIDGLTDAASNGSPEVRIAAAAGVRNLASAGQTRSLMADATDDHVDKVTHLVEQLLEDRDPAVRRTCLKSLGRVKVDVPEVAAMVEGVAQADDDPEAQKLATAVLES